MKIAIDQAGNLLVVGDALGTVHFVHVPSNEIIHSQLVIQDECRFACLQIIDSE